MLYSTLSCTLFPIITILIITIRSRLSMSLVSLASLCWYRPFFVTFGCMHMEVFSEFKIYQINEMIWIFAYFLGCNFTRPYVRGWYVYGIFLELEIKCNQINEMIWMKIFFLCKLFAFVRMYMYKFFWFCLWSNKFIR